MANHAASLDGVFHALADPTRRAVLQRLGRGPQATTDLARRFRMSLPSFLQHLTVLEDSRLVRSTKTGRVRTYELTPGAMQGAEQWLVKQRAVWEQRLDQLDDYLLQMKKDQP